jgi:hypothetical protein
MGAGDLLLVTERRATGYRHLPSEGQHKGF